MKTLILGGVRSGKSRLAERLAAESGRTVIYVATARPGDEEMRQRIERHRADRPADWRTVEAPLALAAALAEHDGPGRCLLVDCLTLWITQLLTHEDEGRWPAERRRLVDLLPGLEAELLLVSNETNQGVVPMDALSRRFCDEAGRLHQALAERCDRVVLTVAGLPLTLKGPAV